MLGIKIGLYGIIITGFLLIIFGTLNLQNIVISGSFLIFIFMSIFIISIIEESE